MDSSDVAQLISLLILLALSAFFSSAETALTTCNRIRMRALAEEGSKKAAMLENILDDQGKMLSAILIGNNIVNLSASSIATILATKYGSAWAGIATGILTILILIFGEISPKTLATIHADKISLSYAKYIKTLMVVLTPFIYVINKLSMGFLLLLRVDPKAKTSTITESELRTIVDVSHEEGVIESEERKMINNVVDFGDSLAKDIMVPRIDMTFAKADATYEELIEIFRRDRFTRLPVYEGTTDDVIGIINMKDLLLYRQGEPFSIRDYLREPHYTYEYKKVAELLREMRETDYNITIVLDEYGATAGLITLEDLLEEIVGDIRDEYDGDEEDSIQKIKDGEYIIEASMKLDDLNELLELGLESEDYDSLGGFIIERLDHLPIEGELVVYETMTFVVEKVEKNRIDKVHMYIRQSDTDQQ